MLTWEYYRYLLYATAFLLGGLLITWGTLFLTLKYFFPALTTFQRLTSGVALGLGGTILAILGLELFFSHVYIMSDGFGITRASALWHEKYWHPINSLGYRDPEYTQDYLAGRKVVIVVGDSFVAGHGTKRASERFPDQLQLLLGDSYRVLAIGKLGWNTTQEAAALKDITSRVKPEKIILSYFINDVERAMEVGGERSPAFSIPSRAQLPTWLQQSYLADLIYWKLFRIRNPELLLRYIHEMERASTVPAVWNAHQQELHDFVAIARETGAPLAVVLFPNLLDFSTMSTLLDRVKGYFEGEGIPLFDMREYLSNLPAQERVVNTLDAHPSVTAHRLVAEYLKSKFFPEVHS